jgi:hypothetical protein
VFKQAHEILAKRPDEEFSDPETDTIDICTNENYKKKVKWVESFFNPAWKILPQVHNERLSKLETDILIEHIVSSKLTPKTFIRAKTSKKRSNVLKLSLTQKFYLSSLLKK